jgi:peptidyl-tRNA hydrolase, PTH1 family
MKMIFGLGNPGKSYRYNRHNAGCLLADEFYNDKEVKFDEVKKKRNFFYVKGEYNGNGFILARSRLFMNVCGESFANLIDSFNFNRENILVLHDDISFQIGIFKFKKDGGDGGHKGIRSIIENMKYKEFCRMRIGIRSSEIFYEDLSDFVLENFSRDELDILASIFPTAIEAIKTWIVDDIEIAMNRFHSRKELREENE